MVVNNMGSHTVGNH